MGKLGNYLSLFVAFTKNMPGLVQHDLLIGAFARIIRYIKDHFIERVLMTAHNLIFNTVILLEKVLCTASDVTRAAQHMLLSGAVRTCCTFLRFFLTAYSSGKAIIPYHTARLLRVFRALASNSSADAAVGGINAAPPGQFATEFVACRGPQALELLWYDDCMQKNDKESSMFELTQLYQLLENMGVMRSGSAPTEELLQLTIADSRAFLQAHKDWQPALNVHLEKSLDHSCYATRLALNRVGMRNAGSPQSYDAPSPATVALLQARARERILICAPEKLAGAHTKSDALIGLRVYNGPALQAEYTMKIRLNDDKFPCNAAHFRASARLELGMQLHTCFLPPEQDSDAPLSFVTFFHIKSKSFNLSCATAPLALPDCDLLYGEYTAAAIDETAVHPVGTVLMYPDTVVPDWTVTKTVRCSTPWFIVFKPCRASLLRGAVPVGRVTSSVVDRASANHDAGEEPFDAALLKCFVTRCKA